MTLLQLGRMSDRQKQCTAVYSPCYAPSAPGKNRMESILPGQLGPSFSAARALTVISNVDCKSRRSAEAGWRG